MRSRTASEGAVPSGTGYEAREGARGGSAARKENCQETGKSGGEDEGEGWTDSADGGASKIIDGTCAVTKAYGATTNGGWVSDL